MLLRSRRRRERDHGDERAECDRRLTSEVGAAGRARDRNEIAGLAERVEPLCRAFEEQPVGGPKANGGQVRAGNVTVSMDAEDADSVAPAETEMRHRLAREGAARGDHRLGHDRFGAGPIVIGLASQTGVGPRPLVIAVMLGASVSFATPIGYQTNTLVYGAGDDRFSDFLRIGIPMNLIVGASSILAIRLFMPFG